MANRRLVAILVMVLAVVTLIVALNWSAAQDVTAGAANEEEPPRIVAAVPAESVTEYEPDPFEPQRLRSSTVRVRRVALVYSDGRIEVKECP